MSREHPAVPLDSATVILIREAGANTCEVLLLERHAESRAFAGAHVFPGGRVDETDRDPAVQAASRGLTADMAARRLGEEHTPAGALAFWIAAIRELFEEAGVLLASVRGAPLDLADPHVAARFAAHRAALLRGTLDFRTLVEREELALATDALGYFGRWITPVNAPRRFDARFFVAELPPGQEPLHDEQETIATLWLAPAAALARARTGALTLAPPTARTLEELHELGSCARILAAARQRAVRPILPRLVAIGGRMHVLFPDDPEYDLPTPGADTSPDASRPLDRFVMEGGTWRSLRAPARAAPAP